VDITLPKQGFDKLLIEAVDEGLSALGESSKQAIYFHIEKSFNVEKEEIPDKVEVFAVAIEKIFGVGANFLEALIMQRLYQIANGSLKWNRARDLTFTEYVAVVRRCFFEKRTEETAEELIRWEEIGKRS
jgi:hypothetical protein